MNGEQQKFTMALVGDAILKTAVLANQLCIQTKGELMIPEEDFASYVQDFQSKIAKRIMPLKTMEDLRDEASKYIKELLSKQQGNETDAGNSNGRTESNIEGSISIDKGENV